MHLKVDHYTGGKVFIHGPNHCKVAKPETRLLIVLSKVCQMISKGELSRKLPKSRNMYVGKHWKKSLVIVYAIKTYPTENVPRTITPCLLATFYYCTIPFINQNYTKVHK